MTVGTGSLTGPHLRTTLGPMATQVGISSQIRPLLRS
jgi:hypothetical protein